MLCTDKTKDNTSLPTASDNSDPRSPYERDYLRVLYSDQFRRLSDKTQVFTAPANSLIHNRLTHSLEVTNSGKVLAK